MRRGRGRRADPRVAQRKALLVQMMYEALSTPHGLVIQSLQPAADTKYCRDMTQDPAHPELSNITVRRDPKSPEDIHLARNDAED